METAQDRRRSSSSSSNNNKDNKDTKDKEDKDNADKDQPSWRSLQKGILKQTFLKDWCEIVVISVSNHPKVPTRFPGWHAGWENNQFQIGL